MCGIEAVACASRVLAVTAVVGTSTDLVPQLLGMFDELARKAESNHGEQIPAAIQKRLSLVAHSQRNSIFGHICANSQRELPTMQEQQRIQSADATVEPAACSRVEITVCNAERDNESTPVGSTNDDKPMYCCEMTTGLMPEYGRRRKHLDRPLSGSSIASSTSSSGCSNQGNACSANPYLASVESLADTCASSQGSGDSGVMTTSGVSCRAENGENEERNSSAKGSPLLYHRARYYDPQRNPVERVLLEIVDTEAVYVEHLRQVIEGYLIFWRDEPACLVQQLQLNHLFSNIEDIFRFNGEFLKEIEACGLDPVSVAHTFTKHNAGFKVYTEYCTNYPRTVSVLTDLMSREDTAKAFRERQAALGHALPLGSFLLKPVQRILKYHLLLENLSKEYEADEKRKDMKDDRNAIEEALAAMTGIAKHINAMKRRHEHAVRVQEIQSLLYGWPGPDLTTSGELIAEGRFRMRGAKAPRHAFLFERMLLLTKKKEDGLLVYKAHIMCSNLMLIESIPGEPCSFHVIPFDNPRLQYTLQARNLEQKREWTLQIKRVMLENYNAVIPIHARQLVLQLGQTQHDEDGNNDRGSAKKLYSAPPEYLKRRKVEKERRRSEAGLRQKKKFSKMDNSALLTVENSPPSSRKRQSAENSRNSSRDPSLNRSLDSGRASKVKDRFTNWRRKSEPGFQSYVSFNQSDDEEKSETISQSESATQGEVINVNSTNENDNSNESQSTLASKSLTVANTKDVNEQKTQVRTVEEIVGHILMQNQEFQRLLEKQRTNSLANVRQQRFKKHQRSVDTSDDSDNGEQNYSTDFGTSVNNNNNMHNNSNSNNIGKSNRPIRNIRREHRFLRSNNAWNSLSPPLSRENQSNLQLQYNNLHTDSEKSDIISKNKVNRVHEKKAVFEAFKRQSIVTESKIIRTALRMRENSGGEEKMNDTTDEKVEEFNNDEDKNKTKVNLTANESSESNFGNYDNLQHIWSDLNTENRSRTGNHDSPTRPAIWLTKLCEGLPTSPLKSGSLPRSFQISPNPPQGITKARFLQRDGKPLSERPFTIASDKPAEINLEDMERYASSYQPEEKIAKFPISVSSTSSSFFCSIDDNLTDVDSDVHSTNIHPDHKIYRANISGSTMLKNVLSKAGSRLQGLRSTASAETLECTDFDKKPLSSPSNKNNTKFKKKKFKSRLSSRESFTDIDEPTVGCLSSHNSFLESSSLYYKQGSSGLGARIAQADYADPSVLFFDTKRSESNNADNVSSSLVNSVSNLKIETNQDETSSDKQRLLSDGENFYEKCFESIENYVDETDDAFRDSAIFSDVEEITLSQFSSNICNNDTGNSSSNNIKNDMSSAFIKQKVAPPVPMKRKIKNENYTSDRIKGERLENSKPDTPPKPEKLILRTKIINDNNDEQNPSFKTSVSKEISNKSMYSTAVKPLKIKNSIEDDKNDISAGQSQAGWVKRMVGQLQAQIETL
ncbi:putative uncharacterized protein DDB_G0293878 isoform X2 [Chelonus insularis]|uniref:putative uncharacterized protein DDB_G0293878 isoform X2 n=1 Tax=Chelonus insularis TaxID=460826 RepID=UPI00158C8182|nr:putative uncharacterized protein DDB_G0293878 isoform X2 [Chelonus insularis]